MRRTEPTFQRNSNEFWRKFRPAGQHSPSNWPRQLLWNSVHQACTSAKGPQRLATGRPAPLVGLSPRAFGLNPLLPYPFCFRLNSLWLNSNKIMNELHRKSEIVSWKWFVLSFISYTSTCLPWNTCLGPLAVLLIDPCDMMTWGCANS